MGKNELRDEGETLGNLHPLGRRLCGGRLRGGPGPPSCQFSIWFSICFLS